MPSLRFFDNGIAPVVTQMSCMLDKVRCFIRDNTSMLHGVRGGRVLLPSGEITETALRFDGLVIDAVDAAPASVGTCLDADGLLVLPGIVDIHGDAFERQLMPRPRVSFPVDMALLDTDRQLLANGITTAFHGITCSWEGGLRGSAQARTLIDAIVGANLPLGAEHCVHLRFETYHLEAIDEIIDWIETGRVDFLAFNDHLPSIAKKAGNGGIATFADRSGISEAEFRALLARTAERAREVPAGIERVAARARTAGIRLASHDDDTELQRRWYHAQGAAISEFPRTEAATQTARTLGNHVVLGAPNVVRGGSHTNAVDAAEYIGRGLCDVLASDYYYPALACAPFRLAADGVLPIHRSWSLVSRNPARAAGLNDRGEIAPGQRADFVLIDDRNPQLPHVRAVIVGGEPRYAAQRLRLN